MWAPLAPPPPAPCPAGAQEGTSGRMKAVLPSLGMVLLGAFCAQADVVVQPGFDPQKFVGTWEILGGVSDCLIFQSMKDLMKTSAAIVKVLPSGNMKLITGFPFPGECKKVDMFLKKTEQPGHYTSEDEFAKRDVRIMDTDYDTYCFLYSLKEVEDEPPCTTIQIYARGSKVTDDMKERFAKLYHTVGLTDDLAVYLPYSDECLKALSG